MIDALLKFIRVPKPGNLVAAKEVANSLRNVQSRSAKCTIKKWQYAKRPKRAGLEEHE
jgi:hypothetical protein